MEQHKNLYGCHGNKALYVLTPKFVKYIKRNIILMGMCVCQNVIVVLKKTEFLDHFEKFYGIFSCLGNTYDTGFEGFFLRMCRKHEVVMEKRCNCITIVKDGIEK